MRTGERNLLHLNKIYDFAEWASSIGFRTEAPKTNCYEILRLRRGTEPPLIYYEHHGGEHASFSSHQAYQLAKKFVFKRRLPARAEDNQEEKGGADAR